MGQYALKKDARVDIWGEILKKGARVFLLRPRVVSILRRSEEGHRPEEGCTGIQRTAGHPAMHVFIDVIGVPPCVSQEAQACGLFGRSRRRRCGGEGP